MPVSTAPSVRLSTSNGRAWALLAGTVMALATIATAILGMAGSSSGFGLRAVHIDGTCGIHIQVQADQGGSAACSHVGVLHEKKPAASVDAKTLPSGEPEETPASRARKACTSLVVAPRNALNAQQAPLPRRHVYSGRGPPRLV